MACFGSSIWISVRTNPVLGITGLARGLSSCGLHRSTFDDDAGGHIFPESDKQLSRQRHDRRLAQAAAVALYAVVEPESECRVPADAAAIARRAGSSSFVVADCLIARCLARDRLTRFARALGQGRHKRLSDVGSRRAEKVPPTRAPPRTPARCPSRSATSPARPAL